MDCLCCGLDKLLFLVLGFITQVWFSLPFVFEEKLCLTVSDQTSYAKYYLHFDYLKKKKMVTTLKVFTENASANKHEKKNSCNILPLLGCFNVLL